MRKIVPVSAAVLLFLGFFVISTMVLDVWKPRPDRVPDLQERPAVRHDFSITPASRPPPRPRTIAPVSEQTVLVVDDEEAIAEAVRARLESEGYRVVVAADGPEAIEAHAEHQPDLVVLDLMLPGMDGLEVCKQIQQDRWTPVLMLTAKTEEADKVAGFAVGADDYLTKPFSLRELDGAGQGDPAAGRPDQGRAAISRAGSDRDARPDRSTPRGDGSRSTTRRSASRRSSSRSCSRSRASRAWS